MKNFKKLLAGVVAIATIGTAMAIPTNAIILKPSDSDDTTTADYYKENAITEAVIELTAPEFGDGIGTYYFLGTGEPSIDLSVFSDEDITNIKNDLPVKIDDTVDVSAVEKVITIDNVKDNCILIDIGYYYTHMSYEYYDGINSWCIEESIIPKETTEDTTTTTEQTTTSATGEIKHDYYKTGSLSEVDGKNITVIVGNEPVTINLDDIDYTNAITDDDIGVLISVTFDGNTDEIKSISVIPQTETTTIPHQTEVPTTTVSDDSTATDDDTTIGDSTEKVELNETPTGIRGDVNYDGEVNAIDLLLLKKYLLQLITW